MVQTMRQWATLFCIGFGLVGFAAVASAATVDDPTFTAVSAELSSDTPGASGATVDVTFTTDSSIPSDSGFNLTINQVDCAAEPAWQDCYWSWDGASVSGISELSIDTGASSDTNLFLRRTSSLPAGTYTVSVSGVTLPDHTGAYRAYMSTSASDTSGLEGYTVQTKSDPFTLGSILAYGIISDNDDNFIQTNGQVRDQNWTVYGGFNSDEWGYYAVSAEGFSGVSTVYITVYPDSVGTGLAVTTDQFGYNGAPVEFDITPAAASKTITGTVTYSDNGDAVTTVALYASSTTGNNSNVDADDNGEFSLTLGGGSYKVCLTDQYDSELGKNVPKDWYVQWDDQCQDVNFANDASVESEELEFVVDRADARIEGVFKNPDGSFPADGGWVSFWIDALWFGGNVDSEDGSFSVAVVGGNSSITATTLHKLAVGSKTYQVQYRPNNADEYTYWDETTVTVNADQELDLGVITLAERDVVYTATVVDQEGSPLEGMQMSAWQDGGGWTNAQTDENGEAVLRLYPGKWTLRPDTWNMPTYIYSGMGVQTTFESGDVGSGTFELQATTLTVTVQTKDSDGNILPINGSANCWSKNGGSGFGRQLEQGIATMGAVGGEYMCNVYVQGESQYQAASQDSYTFVDGEDQTIDIEMVEKNASATVYIKDQDSNLVTDVKGWVNANSTTGSWINERFEDGVAEFNLAAGAYSFGASFEDNNSYIAGWTHYGEETVIAEGEHVTKTISVQSVTASLKATLEDSDGNPVPNAWVNCSNWSELKDKVTGDFSGGNVIENGRNSGTDGVAVIGLVADHEYDCWVGVPSDLSLISPGVQHIDLKTDDQVSKTFVFNSANATIEGTVEFSGSSDVAVDDMDFLWCNGWAEEGYSSNDDSSSTEFSLPVIEGNWHVWCGTQILNEDGTRSWYNSSQDTLVEVSSEGSISIDPIVLSESVFEIPESVSETFDSTVSKTIVLPDGTVLTIPANALATEGNVTLTAEPELQSVNTYSDHAFGFPWNFEVYDSNGVLISGNFNEAVTITISYDEDKLVELGLDESIILPKVWSDTSGAWVDVANAVQDTTANTITFTVEHFTQIGLVYDNQLADAAASSKPLRPRNLVAQHRKVHSAVLDWRKPANAGSVTVKRYKVQVRKYQVKDKSHYRKFVVRSKTRRKVKNLKAGTEYQFRVRACNVNGCSNWSKWDAFTTKTKS